MSLASLNNEFYQGLRTSNVLEALPHSQTSAFTRLS